MDQKSNQFMAEVIATAKQFENGEIQDPESLKLFNASKESASAAMEEMKHGFPCKCGGILRYAFKRSLCYNSKKHVMYDRYLLKCSNCEEDDVFVKDLPHLHQMAEVYKASEHDLTVTNAQYGKAEEEGRHG